MLMIPPYRRHPRPCEGRRSNAWHAEFRERAVIVAQVPNDDLGFRNMTIKDPDGNQLRFMAPAHA